MLPQRGGVEPPEGRIKRGGPAPRSRRRAEASSHVAVQAGFAVRAPVGGDAAHDQTFDDNSTPVANYSKQPKRVAASVNADKDNIILAWADESEYLTSRVRSAVPMEMSPYLDLARRRAIWKGVTPLAFLLAIVSGIATASTGLPVMACVMAIVFVATATIGRLVWPS